MLTLAHLLEGMSPIDDILFHLDGGLNYSYYTCSSDGYMASVGVDIFFWQANWVDFLYILQAKRQIFDSLLWLYLF